MTAQSKLNVLYVGCLDSDPYFSLKGGDRAVLEQLRLGVSGYGSSGVTVRELKDELPRGKVFRKLNRNLLYPAFVGRAIRNQPSTINYQLSILHIGSQCYAHLIPVALKARGSRCVTSRPLVSITVHDVAEFDYPEDYTPAQYKRLMKRLSYIKGADLVFAISEFTKKEIIKHCEVPEEKIVVNANGVGPEFRKLRGDELSKQLGALGARHSVLGEVLGSRGSALGTRGKELQSEVPCSSFLVLSPGNNIYRKNLPTLLKAVAELRSRGIPVKLVKVGEELSTKHKELSTKLNLSDHIIEIGFVDKDDLVGLYNSCDVLAFPSLYEGFGLPVIEAQKCGLSCVISNAASLPEVGGDGVLYHDPEDHVQLAEQLQRVWEDRELREELVEKGCKNAERFSWKKHVDMLTSEWKKLV